jgi:hypothetical protein
MYDYTQGGFVEVVPPETLKQIWNTYSIDSASYKIEPQVSRAETTWGRQQIETYAVIEDELVIVHADVDWATTPPRISSTCMTLSMDDVGNIAEMYLDDMRDRHARN